MNLLELKNKVNAALELAEQMNQDPTNVLVTLQLEHWLDGSLWSADNVELFYDGNDQFSGLLLSAFLNEVI